MRLGTKVLVCVSLFLINLVGKGAIGKTVNENIQEGERIFILDFHCKLNMGRIVVNMVKKGNQRGMTMRQNQEGIINKTKPTFRLKMETV
jgi:hypothetical protein